jgi:hypothetical protein
MVFCFTFVTPLGSPSVSKRMMSLYLLRWFNGLGSLNI